MAVALGEDHALAIHDHDHGTHQVPALHLLRHHASEIAFEDGGVYTRADRGRGAAREGEGRDEQDGGDAGETQHRRERLPLAAAGQSGAGSRSDLYAAARRRRTFRSTAQPRTWRSETSWLIDFEELAGSSKR